MKFTPLLTPAAVIFGLLLAKASAQNVVPPFDNYSSILGGAAADYAFDGFSLENAPAELKSGTSGAANQWLQGLIPTSGAPGMVFSGNSSFGTDTTDFLSSTGGGGIYAFFSQTHFQISSTVPITNLHSLMLQIYLAEGLTGMFGGTSVDLVTAPTLSITTTSGTTTIPATYSALGGQTSAVVNGMSTSLDLLNYQWDLSGITGTPESYTLNWQTSYHSVTYGEDVTESSSSQPSNILVQSVPEPSTIATATGGLGLLLIMRRRSRKAFSPA
jgi:hypothetical protein